MIELDSETLEAALGIGGWMLAEQAWVASRGETSMPLVAFVHADNSASKFVPKNHSGLYHEHVAVGRDLISEKGGEARYWVFGYGEDFEDSGRALIVEVGVGGSPENQITFAQRYFCHEGFRLFGDLELVGEELLPPGLRESLESLRCRYLLMDGATTHHAAGQEWSAWYSARAHEKLGLQMGRFQFDVPEGWLFRRARESKGGCVITRLLPWEYLGLEPTIVIVLIESSQTTLEDVLQHSRSYEIGRGGDVFKAEIARLPSPALSSQAAYLASRGEWNGRSYKQEDVWVPTDKPGRFLSLSASTFNEESWEGLLHALEAVLTSLDLAD